MSEIIPPPVRDHPSRRQARDEHERQLRVVTTTLELAIFGHSNPTRQHDPEALANEAYRRIRQLDRITEQLRAVLAEATT